MHAVTINSKNIPTKSIRNFSTISFANDMLDDGMRILSFPEGVEKSLTAANVLAEFIQGSLEAPAAFIIPKNYIPVAMMAFFNAPACSSEVVFIAEPAYRKDCAVVLTRQINEPDEP